MSGKWLYFVGLVGLLVMVSWVQMGCARARLGVREGRLAPCPKSPNCVSTQATDEVHRIEPIRYAGSKTDARERILKIIRSMPRTRIVRVEEDYIHATFRSRIFRFVDDVEFYFDDRNQTIHFRSASRIGYGDFGVNRARMETVRKEFVGKE